MTSQKTLSEAVGAIKTVTVTADPADADNATAIVSATTAASSDDKIATVKVNSAGGFDITGIAAGSATVTFTSGTLTASVAVTITAAS